MPRMCCCRLVGGVSAWDVLQAGQRHAALQRMALDRLTLGAPFHAPQVTSTDPDDENHVPPSPTLVTHPPLVHPMSAPDLTHLKPPVPAGPQQQPAGSHQINGAQGPSAAAQPQRLSAPAWVPPPQRPLPATPVGAQATVTLGRFKVTAGPLSSSAPLEPEPHGKAALGREQAEEQQMQEQQPPQQSQQQQQKDDPEDYEGHAAAHTLPHVLASHPIVVARSMSMGGT